MKKAKDIPEHFWDFMEDGDFDKFREKETTKVKDLGLTYEEAMHGVQSAIQFKISNGWDGASPKHLRTGVDGSKSDMLGLVELLISKGVFTSEEYIEHVRLAANSELAMEEEYIKQNYNLDVSFR